MQQIVIRIVIPVLISIILGILLSYIDKSNNNEIIQNLTKEHIIIRLPKAYLWVGCIYIAFFATFLFLMLYYPNNTASMWMFVFVSLFILLGIIIVAATQIWKIEVFRHKTYFIYRTMFCKKHKIQYKECVSYKFGTNYFILKTEKKTFFIDNKATNFEFIGAMLTQHKINEKR